MSWIKRNLYFVIGSVVALLLLGVAGYYTYSNWQGNASKLADLNKGYDDLDALYKLNPNPGSGKVDNIAAATNQQAQVREVISRARKFFEPIRPIPNSPRVTGYDFTTALSRTIERLQRDAVSASVALPSAKYSFSFLAESDKVSFEPGSLNPLAQQLGEVRAICDVLFQAKVNSLDSLRREPISNYDLNGPKTDYLEQHTVTNAYAIWTPYEVNFRCFSTELASVLSGLASSPHGLLPWALSVEPAPAATPAAPAVTLAPVTPATPAPVAVPPPSAADKGHEGMWFNDLTRQWEPVGKPPPGAGAPTPTPQPLIPTPTPVPRQIPGLGAVGATPTVTTLEEKPLSVTMLIYVVKLLPQK